MAPQNQARVAGVQFVWRGTITVPAVLPLSAGTFSTPALLRSSHDETMPSGLGPSSSWVSMPNSLILSPSTGCAESIRLNTSVDWSPSVWPGTPALSQPPSFEKLRPEMRKPTLSENSGPSSEPWTSQLLREPPMTLMSPASSSPGSLLTTFTAPANALRPKYADCGPFSTSTRSGRVTLFSALAEDTGTPSMKVAVSVDEVRDGVRPRSVICWNERSLRPEFTLVICRPGVLLARSLSDTMPLASISAPVSTDTATGVWRMSSARLRAVTTISSSASASASSAATAVCGTAISIVAADSVGRRNFRNNIGRDSPKLEIVLSNDGTLAAAAATSPQNAG